MPFGICRVFHIPIAGTGGDSGTSLSLETNHGASLFAAVLVIELVHQIPEGREVVGGLVQAVHAVVDGDKAHTITWEDEFRVLTHLKVFTTQSGHVLDDECFHLTVFHQFHDLLPAWAIEVRSRVTVVIQEEGVGESFLSCILLEQKFLILDTVRVIRLICFLRILLTQPAIEDGIFFVACHCYSFPGKPIRQQLTYRISCPMSILKSNLFPNHCR